MAQGRALLLPAAAREGIGPCMPSRVPQHRGSGWAMAALPLPLLLSLQPLPCCCAAFPRRHFCPCCWLQENAAQAEVLLPWDRLFAAVPWDLPPSSTRYFGSRRKSVCLQM